MGCKCINPGNEEEIKARDQKGENTSFIEEENNNQIHLITIIAIK